MIRTSPYRPACNGMLDRYQRTPKYLLGKIIEDNQRNWDTKVQFVMTSYRASVHDATGYTPNLLTLCRKVRALLVVILGPAKEDTRLRESDNDFVDDQQEHMRSAYDAVRENLRRCAIRRKKIYNLRVKKQDTQRGVRLWNYNPRRGMCRVLK